MSIPYEDLSPDPNPHYTVEFTIGEKVVVDDQYDIPATVQRIMIGSSITYEVTWWNDRTIVSDWFASYRLKKANNISR